MAVIRGAHGKLQKGSVLNPTGRPVEFRDFKKRCQEFMEAEGWGILIGMAKGKGKEKRAAIELLAGYGYGRPKQGLEMSGDLTVEVIKRAWDESNTPS